MSATAEVPAGFSLSTLREALLRAGMQAEAIKARERSGSTYEVADDVSREVEFLSESVREEMKARTLWGVR